MKQKLRDHFQRKALGELGIDLRSLQQLHGNACLRVECPSQPGPVQVRATGERPVSFGAYSYMRSGGELHHVAAIGRFCSIADRVLVGAHPRLHPVDWLSTHPFQYDRNWTLNRELDSRLNYASPVDDVVIGNDVWIGANVVIHAGVSIGDGAVIAHHSVVTRDVAPYQIVAGIPAKPVGQRFDDAIVAQLLALQWWNLATSELAGISFNRIGQAIAELETRIENGAVLASYPRIDITRQGFRKVP